MSATTIEERLAALETRLFPVQPKRPSVDLAALRKRFDAAGRERARLRTDALAVLAAVRPLLVEAQERAAKLAELERADRPLYLEQNDALQAGLVVDAPKRRLVDADLAAEIGRLVKFVDELTEEFR